MNAMNAVSQVMVGDDVYGSGGEKVGAISSVQENYIVVEKGFFFPTDYYIPFSAITSASDNRVTLNVTKDVARHSGWDMLRQMKRYLSGTSGTIG